MLTNDQLRALLADTEADNVERTTSVNDTTKFCEAICAFANDLSDRGEPGYLIVGAHDNGDIAGIEITDQLLQNLASHRDSGQIVPLPSLSVWKASLPEGDVAVVEVQPSDMPPVRYRGRICVRVGPRRGYATEQEERRLTERRLHSAKSFDMQPCLGTSEEEIVWSLFEDYRNAAIAPEIIDQNDRERQQQMAALGLWDTRNQCLTHAGVLLVSESPQAHLPGAYLQYVRYEGEGLDSDVLDERQFSGDLATILRELDAFLRTLFPSRPVVDSALREKQVTPYPVTAIRELLMNAVMHRDYQSNAPIRFYWFSNRIEIQNPGGLFGNATDFPNQNDYRNPKIAECLKVLGYVNRFGRGIAAVQAALSNNTNPPAEFDTSQTTYFLATVREVQA